MQRAVGHQGLDPLFYAQTILIATLYSLLAFAEMLNSRPWWGDLMFPLRCAVRMSFNYFASVWSVDRGAMSVLLKLLSIFSIFMLFNVAGTPRGIPLLGGTQAWLYALGPATIPLFLVISPFSLPFLMTHPDTNTPEWLGWVTVFGLLGLNLLAGWALVSRWREWHTLVPWQAMAIEPLTEEALVAYFQQDEFELQREAEESWRFGPLPHHAPDDAGVELDEEDDSWMQDESEDEDWRDDSEREAAPAAPVEQPRPRVVKDADAVVEVELIPRLSAIQAIRHSVLGSLGGMTPVFVLLVLIGGRAKNISQADSESLRLVGVVLLLSYFIARASIHATAIINHLPKRSALPLSWKGVCRDFMFGSLRRDWWHAILALVLLVAITLPHTALLLPPLVAVVASAYWCCWLSLRHRGESSLLTGNGHTLLIVIGIVAPGFVALLGTIIFLIDSDGKLSPLQQVAFCYWAVGGFAAYAAVLLTAVLKLGRRRRDDAIIAELS